MINISKCATGIKIKNNSSVNITKIPLHIQHSYKYGIYCLNNSNLFLSSATSGVTHGSAARIYNSPVGILASNSSTIENLSYVDIKRVNYGVVASNNSVGLLYNSLIDGAPGITFSTKNYSGCIAQTSVLHVYDVIVTNFGSATGASGASKLRSQMDGTIIVESDTTKATVSTGKDNSGSAYSDPNKSGLLYYSSDLSDDQVFDEPE